MCDGLNVPFYVGGFFFVLYVSRMVLFCPFLKKGGQAVSGLVHSLLPFFFLFLGGKK